MATLAEYQKLKPTLLRVAGKNPSLFLDAVETAARNALSGAALESFLTDVVTGAGVDDVDSEWNALQQNTFEKLERFLNSAPITEANRTALKTAFKNNVDWDLPSL